MPNDQHTPDTGVPLRKLSQESANLLDDTLNASIIRMLRADGRASFSEIAQSLGVSEGTIRNRVNGMKSAGVLRITAVTDVSAAEYRTEAMLGVKLHAGVSPDVVAKSLSELDDVVYVAWVSGRFDLLVEVITSGSQHSYVDVLTKSIYGREGIDSIEIMTSLKNFKNQFLLK
ncbi:AsnC family transcriptional regulator [Pseudohalocynthiibacter aestuariivivens]|uniref:AsnC family transcriptional regulator n=2 Tax=Roseovarius pelagicus TaxID=2980108 RepID=A0ABY6DCF0_9RHOB|nr:AsnC family transcriptional regulator [Pseudohalocynthiibacter aestuariivivens]QIE45232.1 AsnC family transcriptional regulator [Pseudohalocynthiibacter aestuariivivens]UXX82863.1 AsnC family transcriptional regulator [Roseovarius pelagicus]